MEQTTNQIKGVISTLELAKTQIISSQTPPRDPVWDAMMVSEAACRIDDAISSLKSIIEEGGER
jgi:hypothetical protein